MEITKLVCDRCDASAETALARTGWNQITIAPARDGLLTKPGPDKHTRMHICTMCTEALLAFMPTRDRIDFAKHHLRHEETFDIVLDDPPRIAPEQTCQLKETRSHMFRIRRLALLVARPEDWLVEAIYVGNRDQLVQPPGGQQPPGQPYMIRGSDLIDRVLDDELETVQEHQELRIAATYLGKDPEGAEWRGVRVTAIMPGVKAPDVLVSAA